jgi:hypothetical protein
MTTKIQKQIRPLTWAKRPLTPSGSSEPKAVVVKSRYVIIW